MEFLNKIRLLLWIFVIVGIATAYIDYTRVTTGEAPVFCTETYDERTKEDKCRGIFYVMDRVVKRSPSERLNLSKKIEYRYLNQKVNIKLPVPKKKQDFVLSVTPSIDCPNNNLYFEKEEQLIYIDCIASIRYKETNKKESVDLKEALEKDPTIIESIIKNLSLTGVGPDKVTEEYITLDDKFVNKNIKIYRCNKNKIIITLNNNKSFDYCS